MDTDSDSSHETEQSSFLGSVAPIKRKWRKYQITRMRNGLWRAECYQPDCGWFLDPMTENGAENEVASHASYHGSRYKRSRNKSPESGESHGTEGARPDP